MKSQYDVILRLSGISSIDFDQDGLRWPRTTLELVNNEILFYSTPEAAKFVDRTVFEIIAKNNEAELQLLLVNVLRTPIVIEGLNTTSIGNLAFVATFASLPELQTAAFKKLFQLRQLHLIELSKGTPNASTSKIAEA